MDTSSTGTETVKLLHTKFHMPRLAADLIERPHLLAHLDRGLDRKLTVVSAPAGYGKTTLIVHWLRSLQSKDPEIQNRIAWLSLDKHDDDLLGFLNYFVAAIQTIFAAVCPQTANLGQLPQLPPLDFIATTLTNELADLPEDFVLVLDDFHLINDSSINRLLTELLDHLPLQLHLVIVARIDPPLPLAKLRVQQQLIEMRQTELSFTVDEVQAYLAKTINQSLPSETAALLRERTEGWGAGLRMAVLSMRGQSDPAEFVQSFSGDQRHVTDYLIDEVMAQQPLEVQEFMLQTSILSRFCAVLGDAVTGKSTNQSQEIIERLEQANLFVVPLDEKRGWYRYHHLFQEMLNHRLQAQLSQEAFAALHDKASSWLGQHGFIDEAIRHALAAENVSGAIQLIDHHRHDLLNQSKWRLMERWLKLLPDQVVGEEPTLLILQAWLLLHTLKLGEMNLALQEAEKRLDNDAAMFPRTKALTLRGEIDTMRSYFWNVVGNDRQQGFECAQRALKNLPQTYSFARGMALDFECFAYYFSGQKDRAIRLLAEAAYNPTHLGPSKLQTFIGLCHLYLVSGNLPRLSQTADDFLQLAVENRQTIGIAWAHYFNGFARYEWNELDAAINHFSKVAELRYGASAIAFKNSLYPLALAYQNQGEPDKAQETLDTLHAYFREIRNTAFLWELGSVQARLSLLQGDLNPAVQWAQAVNLDDLRDSPFNFEVQRITWSSVHIAQGTTTGLQEATQHLRKILATAEEGHNIRWIIQTLVNLALAYKAQGQTEAALDTLERSVKLAQPGGFIRTFSDLGPAMAQLLYQLVDQGVASDYVGRILAAFPEAPLTPEVRPITRQAAPAELVEPLSARELEVLELIAELLSDREIAQELTISVLTVKTHARNIYRKLDVKGRMQAVARVKILGILPPD